MKRRKTVAVRVTPEDRKWIADIAVKNKTSSSYIVEAIVRIGWNSQVKISKYIKQLKIKQIEKSIEDRIAAIQKGLS